MPVSNQRRAAAQWKSHGAKFIFSKVKPRFLLQIIHGKK